MILTNDAAQEGDARGALRAELHALELPALRERAAAAGIPAAAVALADDTANPSDALCSALLRVDMAGRSQMPPAHVFVNEPAELGLLDGEVFAAAPHGKAGFLILKQCLSVAFFRRSLGSAPPSSGWRWRSRSTRAPGPTAC